MKGIKKSYVLIIPVMIGFILYLFMRNGWHNPIDVDKIQEIVESFGVWGGLVFLIIASIRPFLFIPSPVLFLMGGILYGWIIGSILNLVGLLIGALLCHILAGRFQGFFVKLVGSKYIDKLEQLKGRETIRALFMMRVTPGFPFDPISYGAGLTGINRHDFLLGTFLGSTPKVFLYGFLGDGIEDIFSLRTIIVFLILILLACLPLIKKKKPTHYAKS